MLTLPLCDAGSIHPWRTSSEGSRRGMWPQAWRPAPAAQGPAASWLRWCLREHQPQLAADCLVMRHTRMRTTCLRQGAVDRSQLALAGHLGAQVCQADERAQLQAKRLRAHPCCHDACLESASQQMASAADRLCLAVHGHSRSGHPASRRGAAQQRTEAYSAPVCCALCTATLLAVPVSLATTAGDIWKRTSNM